MRILRQYETAYEDLGEGGWVMLEQEPGPSNLLCNDTFYNTWYHRFIVIYHTLVTPSIPAVLFSGRAS